MTSDHRRVQLQARLATAALGAVLVVLVALALVQAGAGERSADRLERSADLVEAYLTINRAVADQDAVEDQYSDMQPGEGRARFRSATRRIDRALDVLLRQGEEDDRLLARRLGITADRYSSAIANLFVALDSGDEELADRIDEIDVDAWSSRLGTFATESGPQHAAEALEEVDALRATQRRLRTVTLVTIPVALLVVLGLWWTLRSLRRRLDAGRAHEVQRLEHAALTDNLTGIGNHRAFDEMLRREIARTARSGEPLALMMLDLDGLKAINDHGGHQAGDRAIRAVGDALAHSARAGDGVFRIGGDEYAAILPGTTAWGAFELAQRVHDHAEGAARISVGIADVAGDADPNALVAEADAALFAAKDRGRRTVLHSGDIPMPSGQAPAPADAHQATLAAALARAVDAKDSWTRSHCETVAELCGLIATGLGLSAERVAAIRLAGLVHDVGKIGVPDAILQKPARLDADEFDVIKGHSSLGHKILEGTDLAREAPWVLHHHERIDGGGYPAGLAGDEIPLESRIIHVADAFEAMTSDRPYRMGMSEDEAIAELRRHAGAQFDATCVDALVAALAVSVAA